MLSLNELQNPKIEKVKKDAYRAEDVEAYIEQVTLTVNELKKRYSYYKSRCTALENGGSDNSDKAMAISEILIEAKLSAQNTKKEAEDVAKSIVEEAQEEAENLISSAQRQLANAEASANKKYDEIIAEANAKAESILADANNKSNEILADAEERLDALQTEYNNCLEEARNANEVVAGKVAAAKELYSSVFEKITSALDSISIVDFSAGLESNDSDEA